MIISEMITLLTELKEKHGDLPIARWMNGEAWNILKDAAMDCPPAHFIHQEELRFNLEHKDIRDFILIG